MNSTNSTNSTDEWKDEEGPMDYGNYTNGTDPNWTENTQTVSGEGFEVTVTEKQSESGKVT